MVRRDPRSVPRSRLLPAADKQPPDRRALLLEVVTRIVYPSVLVAGVYLLLAGLHREGGGFAAGLVIGLGLVLRRLAGGPHELGTAAPVSPGALLGCGLMLTTGYGVAGVFLADTFLAGGLWEFHLGPVGQLKVAASLVFETGVVLVVVGIVLDILRTLGAEEESSLPPYREGMSL